MPMPSRRNGDGVEARLWDDIIRNAIIMPLYCDGNGIIMLLYCDGNGIIMPLYCDQFNANLTSLCCGYTAIVPASILQIEIAL